MAKQEFDVVVEKDADGLFWGRVARLKNCLSQGRTLNDLMDNMRNVILLTLDERMYENDEYEDEPLQFVGIQKIEVYETTTRREFYVLVEWGPESGFVGIAPQLQGCLSCGDTLSELRANMEEVVNLCLEDEEVNKSFQFIGIQKVTVYQNGG